jgi:hypothetical protein
MFSVESRTSIQDSPTIVSFMVVESSITGSRPEFDWAPAHQGGFCVGIGLGALAQQCCWGCLQWQVSKAMMSWRYPWHTSVGGEGDQQ